jgi:dihydrofolate synthase / folylpolyglutamate synthase
MKVGTLALSPPELGQYPAIDRLMSMPRYASAGQSSLQPGLGRIRRLLDHLGRPQARFPVVHVAGTNGKGSTASFISSLLTTAGLRCGLHTSPHLVFVGERMRVDGTSASPAWLDERLGQIGPLVQEVSPSYFELTLALSLTYFAEREVDVSVVEVGLGGRLDATNVLEPVVSVVTHVALDHTDILGDSLTAIAREKGGIIRGGVPVVCGRQDPPARAVLEAIAGDRRAPFLDVTAMTSWHGRTLRTPTVNYSRLFPALQGLHQWDNAATAVVATQALAGALANSVPSLSDGLAAKDVRAGLRHVSRLSGLRGRHEIWQRRPLIVLDVAHNPDAMIPALRLFGAQSSGSKNRTVALALMNNKTLDPIAEELVRLEFDVLPIQLPSPRALPGQSLAASLAGLGLEGVQAPVSVAGLKRFAAGIQPDDSLLIVGSFQLVGGFLDAEF